MTKRANDEGSVYKRSDGRWIAAVSLGYVGGRLRRKTKIASSHADAKRKLKELLKDSEQGLALDGDPSLADYLQTWLRESPKVRKLRPRTRSGYVGIVGSLTAGLGRTKLRKLSAGDIDAYLNSVTDSGLSRRTAQLHHAVLRAALEQARKWKMVAENVARDASPPAPERREVAPLTPGEARRFLASVAGERDSALYAVALSLGLRQSEALGLTWPDLDLDAGTVAIRRGLQRYNHQYHLDDVKTQRSRRTISLPAPIVDALKLHRDRQAFEKQRAGDLWSGEWDLVFCNEVGGPLPGTEVTRRFQRKLAALHLPAQRFHDLRHAAATFLLAQGVGLRTVMEILGHSTIATTANVYGHVSQEMQREAMAGQGALLYGS